MDVSAYEESVEFIYILIRDKARRGRQPRTYREILFAISSLGYIPPANRLYYVYTHYTHCGA